MILKHVTSIECAHSIVQSGIYKPLSSNPRHSDAGINCINGNDRNNYENNGVLINFKWSGDAPVLQVDDMGRPYNKNTLYDNGPWRIVVPTGTDQFLMFESIDVKDHQALDDYINIITPWYFKIPFTNWHKRRKDMLNSYFYKSKGKSIVVM